MMSVVTLVSKSEYCVAYAFDKSSIRSDMVLTFDLSLRTVLLARSYSITGKLKLTDSGERFLKASKLISSFLSAPVEIIILLRKKDSSGNNVGFRL
jgi:hypothetical protein